MVLTYKEIYSYILGFNNINMYNHTRSDTQERKNLAQQQMIVNTCNHILFETNYVIICVCVYNHTNLKIEVIYKSQKKIKNK